ncbi:hypothetical protein BVX93_00920 [bacterium B13(2017)]|nr:hypothetical protein BVX93_00920 [bacterium B13(2017)]
MQNIIIIDDDELFLSITAKFLKKNGWDVVTSLNVDEFYKKINTKDFIVTLIDLQIGSSSGIDVIKELKITHPSIYMIICTAHGTIESAVEAMKFGALDYIPKPINYDELKLKLNRILSEYQKEQELHELRRLYSTKITFDNIIGKSVEFKKVVDLCRSVMNTDATILINGETGTGKELIAKAIHNESERKDKPYIVVNCATLVEQLLESELFGHEKGSFTGAFASKQGKFEIVEDGTLFLDEIGEMSLNLQKKLLRVLQENEFERVGSTNVLKTSCRILAATNKDLKQLVSNNEFREDLYYRLNVFPIMVPPLRSRKKDIPTLVKYFVEKNCVKIHRPILNIPKSFISRLMKRLFPGNIRELEHLIERLVITSKGLDITFENQILDDVDMQLLPESECDVTAGTFISKYESFYFKTLLNKFEWDTIKVANATGLSRKTVYMKMREYGLKQI